MKHHIRTMRSGLLMIAITCWLLPIIVILTIILYNSENSLEIQFKSIVDNSVISVMNSLEHSLQEIVTISRYISYDGSIKKAHSEYKTTGDKNKLDDEVRDFMNANYRFMQSLNSSFFFFTEMNSVTDVYYTYNSTVPSPYQSVLEYNNHVHDVAVKKSGEIGTEIFFYCVNDSVYMIRNLLDSNFNPIGVLTFKLNVDYVFENADNIVWNKRLNIFLNDAYIPILGDSLNNQYELPDKYTIPLGGYKDTIIDNDIFIEARAEIDGVDIIFTALIDKKQYLSSYSSIFDLTLPLTLLLIPILAFVIYYFSKHILEPIERLRKGAERLEKGEFGATIKTESLNEEFLFLTNAFNSMSLQIKNQFTRLYNEELALRDAKIMALQMQINPHFLNNTLEIINWEARMGNSAKVSRMIEALSIFLDGTMDRKSRQMIPISTELMYLDSYFYIMQERFGKRLVVFKEIDGSVLHYEIPRLIMQPIIENSIEHGISKKNQGVITVRVYQNDDDNLILSVENNSGLTEEDKKAISELLHPTHDENFQKSSHLGIRNVNERLKIIFGEKASLEIIGDDEITQSIITIPLLKPPEKQ